MLNAEEAQEIKNIAHHIILFNFSLGETKFNNKNIENPSIEP